MSIIDLRRDKETDIETVTRVSDRRNPQLLGEPRVT